MRMRPTSRPMSKKEAQENVDAVKAVMRNVQSFGRDVVGGAKIVGSAIKKKLSTKKK